LKNTHKKIIFVSGLLAALIPFSSKAASLEYASLGTTDQAAQTVVVHYGGLENKLYYSCSTASYNCLLIGSTTPPVVQPASTDTAPVSNPFDVIRDVGRVSYRGVSPDGRWVYYYQYSTATNPLHKFVLLDTKTNGQSSVSGNDHYWDLLTEENRLFSVSPDSKTLFYMDDRAGYNSLYQVDLSHPKANMMTGVKISTKNYAVSDLLFADSSNLVFEANRTSPLIWSLYNYNIKTKTVSTIADGVSYGSALEKVGSTIIFLAIRGNAVVPMGYDGTTGKVTTFNIPETPGITSVSNPYDTFHSGNLWGALLKPTLSSISSSTPLIIWLHGGPYRDISPTIHPYLSYGVYDWSLEQARENGALVLKLDYHGSYGQGRAFASSLQGQAGVIDAADVAQALKAVKAQYGKKYNIQNVYVVGNSYGGYLALKSLVTNPSLYAGAFSINGVTDWPTLLNTIGNSIFNIYFNGLPTLANSKLYEQADIVDHLSVLTTQKMLLIQAQSDTDIGTNQANFFDQFATSRGKNEQLIKIPDEDHVFYKNSSITTICNALVSFVGLTNNTSDRCQYQ
jgi:pimeloyl-ACP methyl ester carboxylesterase